MSRRINRKKGAAVFFKQPRHGLPPRVFVKMKFILAMTDSLATGNAFEASFTEIKANSLIDPAGSGGSTSIRGPDFSSMYKNFKVHKSRASVVLINFTSSGTIADYLMAFLQARRDSPSAQASDVPATIEEAMDFPETKYTYLRPPALQASAG